MTLDLWIVAGILVLLMAPLARFTIYRRQYNQIEDVVLFARRLNIEDLEWISSPAEEWLLRRSTSSQEFRQMQRKRMRLCAEYLSRAAHNGELLQGWAWHTHEVARAKGCNPADQNASLLAELSRTATEVRAFALATRLRVQVWLVVRVDLLPVPLIPHVPDLRNAFGVDILGRYQEMTVLAKRASSMYGVEWSEKMSSAL